MLVSVVQCDCCKADTGLISFMQRFLVCILGGSSSGSRLGTISAPSPQLPLPLGTSPEVIANTAGPSVVISEGILSVSINCMQKI